MHIAVVVCVEETHCSLRIKQHIKYSMDEYSFQAELKNFKVVRRIDSHKNYTNKRQLNAAAKPKARKGESHTSKSSNAKNLVDDVGFWELLESTSKSVLNAQELNRFLACVRIEHGQLHKKLCLNDLEEISNTVSA